MSIEQLNDSPDNMVRKLTRLEKTVLSPKYVATFEAKKQRVDNPGKLLLQVAAEASRNKAHLERLAEPGRLLRSGVVTPPKPVITPTSPPGLVRIAVPQVSPAEIAEGAQWLAGKASERLLMTPKSIPLTRKDLRRLRPPAWLNDEVVNASVELLREQSGSTEVVIMQTNFFTKIQAEGAACVDRWTFGDHATVLNEDARFIGFPTNVGGNHWTLILIDLVGRNVQYFDSLGGQPGTRMAQAKAWLKHEYQSKLDKTAEWAETIDEWQEITWNANHIPQQMNGSDCGVFMLTFMRYLTRGAVMDFTQGDMADIRQLLICELREWKLRRA